LSANFSAGASVHSSTTVCGPNSARNASAGVLGVAVGLAGFLMANTAIALCQQDAAPETAGGLLAFDVTQSGVQTLRPKPRPGCPACAAAGPSRFPFLEASA
jgi:molybdopterin/thiamine biosynthesis adenylyltransferase